MKFDGNLELVGFLSMEHHFELACSRLLDTVQVDVHARTCLLLDVEVLAAVALKGGWCRYVVGKE
jgi:hypothetical protein